MIAIASHGHVTTASASPGLVTLKEKKFKVNSSIMAFQRSLLA